MIDTSRPRTPMTTEQLVEYRPKATPEQPVNLERTLAYVAGIPASGAKVLANLFADQAARIAALEYSLSQVETVRAVWTNRIVALEDQVKELTAKKR